MKLTKKSETSTKITFTYDKPTAETEGYIYYANDVAVSRTFNPNDLEVTFGKVPSGRYAVDAVGFEELDRAEWPEVSIPPPPTGDLRWKPPGYPDYPGYVKLTANTGAEKLDLDNSKDYLIDLGTKQWNSGSGRSIGLHINGGRNVVVIGGKVAFNSTNNGDDSIGVLIDVGTDGGIVHLEGLDIAACNPVTVRSRRIVQLQNCRLTASVFNDDFSQGIHPDLVQCWGTTTGSGGHTPCEAIRMHKVTGYTTYTGLVCLIEIPPTGGRQVDPVTWERWDVDLHPKVNRNGSLDAGNFAYHCSGPVGATGTNGGPFCVYKGEIHAELPTGGGGSYVRGIDDIAILKSLDAEPDRYFPYEIHAPAGQVLYSSPDKPGGGSGRADCRASGNYMTFAREPALAGQRWIIGKPSSEFCPAGVAGPNYVSPGYR